ncbi:MAG: two-component system response regulator CreB [Lentisphaerae bacterium]|nr:two-component system response regulator CreB [Lentisphaerota bacterium]
MAHKILVVEDEPGIADNIRYALSTEGFEVVWSATGQEALDVLKSDGISLVVLDIGLPDRNGFELCKDIRRTSAIPVIFLTARADEIDRVVGLEIGGDDYVVKPFSPRELSARVKAVLRRANAPSDGGGSAPFQVDERKKRIAYFGRPLDLSRYEYRILHVLIGKPGWVFSRDQLMDLAWEEPEASLDRTVDTHIKTLRAKLKEIRPKLDPIRTHRGLGYSLKESP